MVRDISQLKHLRLALFSKWGEIDPADKIEKQWFLSSKHDSILKKMIGNQGTMLLVAEDGKKLIGYNLALKEIRQPFLKPIGSIEETYIVPEYRRMGIGKLFFEKTVEWFRRKKLKWSFVSTHSQDTEAIQFWEKINYREFNKTFKMKL